MIDIDKQIEYWKSGANSNFETAEILINNNKLLEGLFFCHLAIEKILKALVVKETKEIPPKTHDLFYIAKLANIELNEEQISLMQILMKYQLEGRYPYNYPKTPSIKIISEYLNNTKNLKECFNKML